MSNSEFPVEYINDSYLKITYLKTYDDEEFSELHKHLIDFQTKCPNKGLLMVDTKKMGVLSMEKQAHIAKYVVPTLSEQAGQKMRIALLLGDDVFASFGAKNIAQKSDDASVTKPFSDQSEAETWLTESV
ncbi:hypothetical protein FUAX_51370 (plasmid) [Fulvitalea axinellae]|uniref:STAS/SEC14 domain-containing protein n=1 Tax=Fulvitalea axinellae TaxID=1182444 RepID=A0AAU9DJM4_9BACT|nr:hypothetical protein FUAX_51370 [Fulvitalea axinellae]